MAVTALDYEERARKLEARFSPHGWESCDLTPWLAEITLRMHEAVAAKTYVVNLSYTHPRGYIPNQIIRRPQVRQLLGTWQYANDSGPPSVPTNGWWTPSPGLDFETCSMEPFRREVEWRTSVALKEAEGQRVGEHRPVPVVDLTPFHPRGGIHPIILSRMEEAEDPKWREEVEAQIRKLRGDANRALALANTMLAKTEAVSNPRKLKAAAREQRRLAEDWQAEADTLEKSLS